MLVLLLVIRVIYCIVFLIFFFNKTSYYIIHVTNSKKVNIYIYLSIVNHTEVCTVCARVN